MAADPSPLSGDRLPPPPPPDAAVSGNVVKKPAAVWNKLEGNAAAAAICHVIADEGSWPALSEATRNQSKSAADPPPVSTSQGHLISNPKKSRSGNQNHSNTSRSHKPCVNQTTMPARQRSKRGGGSGGGPLQNGISHHPRLLPLPRPPLPPPAVANPLTPPLPPYPFYEGSFGPLPPPMPPFMPPFDGNNWERRPIPGFAPQRTPVNEQSFRSNSNPKGNYAARPRGDGASNSGLMSRRDHHRDRDTSHQGFARPSRSKAPQPPPLPFFPLPSMRPFPDPIGFNMASPYVNFPTPTLEFMRFPPPPLPMLVPPLDPALPSQLISQIDHYFSDDNLAKDPYLRGGMDNEGWVDIAFIADFPMVKRKTQNLQFILDCLRDSTVIEVQGNRIRRRNNWRKWLMSVPGSSTCSSSLTHAGSTKNVLANSLENIKLEDGTNSIEVVSYDDDDKAVSSSDVAHSDMLNNDELYS